MTVSIGIVLGFLLGVLLTLAVVCYLSIGEDNLDDIVLAAPLHSAGEAPDVMPAGWGDGLHVRTDDDLTPEQLRAKADWIEHVHLVRDHFKAARAEQPVAPPKS